MDEWVGQADGRFFLSRKIFEAIQTAINSR